MLVMGVIVILMTLLFPVVIGMKDKARKKQALAEAHAIVLALKGYRMEYGKWPNQTQAGGDTTYFTNNHKIIQPLIGHHPRENPRGKVFLSLQQSNQTDTVTNFTDPWGAPYVICLDENADGDCMIDFTNIVYANIFANTIYAYSATNYLIADMEAVAASFANTTNATLAAPFEIETWSEPQ
jgi:type II secretory pathway pseudopilin PulG